MHYLWQSMLSRLWFWMQAFTENVFNTNIRHNEGQYISRTEVHAEKLDKNVLPGWIYVFLYFLIGWLVVCNVSFMSQFLFLDAIASPSSYPCKVSVGEWVSEWVSEWLIVSDWRKLTHLRALQACSLFSLSSGLWSRYWHDTIAYLANLKILTPWGECSSSRDKAGVVHALPRVQGAYESAEDHTLSELNLWKLRPF